MGWMEVAKRGAVARLLSHFKLARLVVLASVTNLGVFLPEH